MLRTDKTRKVVSQRRERFFSSHSELDWRDVLAFVKVTLPEAEGGLLGDDSDEDEEVLYGAKESFLPQEVHDSPLERMSRFAFGPKKSTKPPTFALGAGAGGTGSPRGRRVSSMSTPPVASARSPKKQRNRADARFTQRWRKKVERLTETLQEAQLLEEMALREEEDEAPVEEAHVHLTRPNKRRPHRWVSLFLRNQQRIRRMRLTYTNAQNAAERERKRERSSRMSGESKDSSTLLFNSVHPSRVRILTSHELRDLEKIYDRICATQPGGIMRFPLFYKLIAQALAPLGPPEKFLRFVTRLWIVLTPTPSMADVTSSSQNEQIGDSADTSASGDQRDEHRHASEEAAQEYENERILTDPNVTSRSWQFNDFAVAMSLALHGLRQDVANLVFDILDVDDDGLLNHADVFEALQIHADEVLPGDFDNLCALAHEIRSMAKGTLPDVSDHEEHDDHASSDDQGHASPYHRDEITVTGEAADCAREQHHPAFHAMPSVSETDPAFAMSQGDIRVTRNQFRDHIHHLSEADSIITLLRAAFFDSYTRYTPPPPRFLVLADMQPTEKPHIAKLVAQFLSYRQIRRGFRRLRRKTQRSPLLELSREVASYTHVSQLIAKLEAALVTTPRMTRKMLVEVLRTFLPPGSSDVRDMLLDCVCAPHDTYVAIESVVDMLCVFIAGNNYDDKLFALFKLLDQDGDGKINSRDWLASNEGPHAAMLKPLLDTIMNRIGNRLLQDEHVMAEPLIDFEDLRRMTLPALPILSRLAGMAKRRRRRRSRASNSSSRRSSCSSSRNASRNSSLSPARNRLRALPQQRSLLRSPPS